MTHHKLRRDNQRRLKHLMSAEFNPCAHIYGVQDTPDVKIFTLASNATLEAHRKGGNLIAATLKTWGFTGSHKHVLTRDELDTIARKLDLGTGTRSANTVNVTLNTFDAEGNQVDTDNMDLTAEQASDIIDHAAQLVVVMRDMVAKRSDADAFYQVYGEMENALTSAGVLDTDDAPMIPEQFL
ncbi:MAG: hypothetical protein AWU57_334 [Marinobacter sp. T13-3]|nr:MAG: hypothetical protein AWU57_334 [Marinobacter sp. T13-3]